MVDDDLTSIVFVDIEAVGSEVDGKRSHQTRDFAIMPAMEDTSSVRSKAYDVAEGFEFGEGFVDDGCVALTVAFHGCSETAETWIH